MLNLIYTTFVGYFFTVAHGMSEHRSFLVLLFVKFIDTMEWYNREKKGSLYGVKFVVGRKSDLFEKIYYAERKLCIFSN